MEFSTFAWYADRIDNESADTAKIDLLSDAFQEAGNDLSIATRFFQGTIFPKWDERKTAVGPSLMYTSIAKAADTSAESVEDIVADVGGAGVACEELNFESDDGQQTLASLDETTITLGRAYDRFAEVAEMSGAGSQARKTDAISDLLRSVSDDTVNSETVSAEEQAKYITRLVLNEMRIGVGPGTVRDAIVDTFNVPSESVKRAIMVSADTGSVAETAREQGHDGLDAMSMEVGRPVESMLASEGTIEDAVAEWDTVIAETKYDGARLQIHLTEDDTVSLFSRGLEDETESLPDIVDIVQNHVDANEAILDAEVVAYDAEDDDEPLPFTEVMKRMGRKHDVDEKSEEIHTNVHVFDVLYRDGETLLTTPLRDRLTHAEEICPSLAATRLISDDPQDLKEFEAEALADGHEGLMLKNPASEFSAGKRGQNWLKVKPDVETLDCVVVGGEFGEGRRAGVIGSYLLAVHGDDGKLKTIGKVATGITDEMLEDLHDRFEPLIESQDGTELSIQPEIVFEVGYEEIYPSPEYTSGYGLRFPRFLGVREDKSVSDADTVDRVENILEGM